MCGFIAQLVEQCTGIAEVTGLNPIEALIFCRLLLSNCLNWKIYCDNHSSLSDIHHVMVHEEQIIEAKQLACSQLRPLLFSTSVWVL